MPVLPIRIYGDPVLHTQAERVEAFGQRLDALIADMFETMRAAPGVGLAAPQIGVPLQVFVYEWRDEETLHHGVAVNPSLELLPLESRSADPETESEGCLSFPSYRFPLLRAERVRLSAQDATGQSFEVEAEGWLARIFQHEFDHLQGLIYTDKLEPVYLPEVMGIKSQEGWGAPGMQWLPGLDTLEP